MKKKSLILYILNALLLILSITVLIACTWAGKKYVFGIREILYTLNGPVEGADTSMVTDGLKACLPIIIPIALLIIVFFVADYRKRFKIRIKGKLFGKKCDFEFMKYFRKVVALLVVGGLIGSTVMLETTFEISAYLRSKNSVSTIYEERYVDPGSVNITDPEEKKNLILIYLESMENTYQSVQEGGIQKDNLIPNLTALAKEGISFSDDEKIGGFRSIDGTTWTAGALFATASGVPFSFPVQRNSMDKYEKFAPGIVTLGDILYERGYTQEFLCGSDAKFGGRKNLFTQHGNYQIYDLFSAQQAGYLPTPDYNNLFWGFEDMYLYEIAKDEITRLYQNGQPFNFTMLTVDTHCTDGYLCSICGDTYENMTANVVACADAQLGEFISWCKEQPFYEDSVIVITGDHPRMDKQLVTEEPDYLERTIYNCFLNAQVGGKIQTKNRDFTAMDMFPTILASLGFEIEGDKLGLGVNMFSKEQTLAEEMGVRNLQDILNMQSNFYLEHFMFERN